MTFNDMRSTPNRRGQELKLRLTHLDETRGQKHDSQFLGGVTTRFDTRVKEMIHNFSSFYFRGDTSTNEIDFLLLLFLQLFLTYLLFFSYISLMMMFIFLFISIYFSRGAEGDPEC